MAEYGALTAEQRTQITAPFEILRQALSSQKRIAMVRDQLRRFEDQGYPQVLLHLEKLTRLPPPQSDPPESDPPPRDGYATDPVKPDVGVAEPKLIRAGSIKVRYPRPWLAGEAELDDYLQRQREAWLKEIQAGNRVQI